jgi:hypothetical protein
MFYAHLCLIKSQSGKFEDASKNWSASEARCIREEMRQFITSQEQYWV